MSDSDVTQAYDMASAEDRHRAAGEYVLGTLLPQEKAAFEAVMAFSPELQTDVQQWREHLQLLDRSLEPVTPPPRVWQNIQQQIRPQKPGFSLKFWQLSAMVSFSFALALATLLLFKPPMLNATMADHLYVVNSPQKQPAWLVNASMDRSHLMVQTIKPADVPAGKVCKLWLKVGDQYAMVGTLPHSGISKLNVPDRMRPQLVNAQIIISIDTLESDNNPNKMGTVVDQGGFMPLEGSLRRF